MSSDEYHESHEKQTTRKHVKPRRKRQKLSTNEEISTDTGEVGPNISLESLLGQASVKETAFDRFFETHLLPECEQDRAEVLERHGGEDEYGTPLRALSRLERALLTRRNETSQLNDSTSRRLILRKLSMIPVDRGPCPESSSTIQESFGLHACSLINQSGQPILGCTFLDALNAIQTTPYRTSFCSRVAGNLGTGPSNLIAVDWVAQSPWMSLMEDIRRHYQLSHPDREHPAECAAPIHYSSLQSWHLPQVHDLLARTFWDGINVSDSLEYWPERCTVVATYKRLVVGLVIISSPRETYITYLTVKPGWDNTQIATSLLYHLIKLNPHNDITLHVSANNTALLLYNRFGFKAEEFVVGFYEDYLDPQSRASKNAFRLRLRHI